MASSSSATAGVPSSSSSSSGGGVGGHDHHDNDQAFVCNICLEGVKDREPVVTQCGHLYCWPCLYRWLNTRHNDGTCPVCKAGVTQDNVIPIFIKDSSIDPRQRTLYQQQGMPLSEHTQHSQAPTDGSDIIPNRPQGHRPEPVNPLLAGMAAAQATGTMPQGIAQFGGTSIAAGMGFFPSLFGLQMQSFAPPPAATDTEEEAYQAYLQRILYFLAFLVVLCLLFF